MSDESQPLAFLARLGGATPLQRTALGPGRYMVGRALDNQYSFPDDATLSRHHAVLHVSAHQVELEDLDSGNGSFVNGHRIRGRVVLQLPAWLLLGSTRLALLPAGMSEADSETGFYSTQGSIIVTTNDPIQRRVEAYMVVDVIGSTELLRRSETALAKIGLVLGRYLEGTLVGQSGGFLKCTGDGFFACFPTAAQAWTAAAGLAEELRGRMPQPPKLSVALHWGTGHLTATGDRTGRDVHGVFALESLRRTEAALAEWLVSSGSAEVTVFTQPFLDQLPAGEQRLAVPVGSFRLKGLTTALPIYRRAAPDERPPDGQA